MKFSLLAVIFSSSTLLMIILTALLVSSSKVPSSYRSSRLAHLFPAQAERDRQRGVGKVNGGVNPEEVCAGEFEMCTNTRACSLTKKACLSSAKSTSCTQGSYVCPDQTGCAPKFSQCPGLKGTFWDTSLDIETRLSLLVNITTLEEQAGQLTNFGPAIDRLYIPEYQWLNDDLHGARLNHTTSFGDGIALGATFSTESMFKLANIIGREARELHHFFVSRGIRGVSDPIINGIGMTGYTPNMNAMGAAHPRWGRVQEVIGSEDPTQTGKMSLRYIQGWQQLSTPTPGQEGRIQKYLLGSACEKHFSNYFIESNPEVRYKYVSYTNGRDLFESYLPHFRMTTSPNAIKESEYNVGSVATMLMCSYNSVAQSDFPHNTTFPTCAHPDLLNGMLRSAWRNYEIAVVSDYDAAANTVLTHHAAPNFTVAAQMCWNAGMDQEGGGAIVNTKLPQAVKEKRVTPQTVATSFTRLFRIRMQLGMFDDPSSVPWAAMNSAEIGDDAHEKVNLAIAQETITLYKNKNGNTIPLELGGKNVVIGPLASSPNWLEGNYATRPEAGVTSVLEAVLNFNCPFIAEFPPVDLRVGFSAIPPSWEQQYSPLSNVTTLQDCRNKCEENLRCNFYTFYAKARTCYLLPVQGPLVKTRGATSGGRHGVVLVLNGISYAEFGDISVKADDARECSQLCRVNKSCARFTYDKLLHQCFLLPIHRSTAKTTESFIVSAESPRKCEQVEYEPACADHSNQCTELTGLDRAIQLAGSAQNVIFVTGLDQNMESEGHDRTTINLPSNMNTLIDLVGKAANEGGGRMIGVLGHGGGFKFNMYIFDGIIDAFYPGQQGGRAIAGALYGEFYPAGRSPYTWYESDSQLPPNLNYSTLYPSKEPWNSKLGVSYRFFTGTPMIPFGHGLTMTKFKYDNLIIEPVSAVFPCHDVNISVTISPILGDQQTDIRNKRVRKNNNKFNSRVRLEDEYESDEVVQLFIKQKGTTQPVPRIRMADFARVKNVTAPVTVHLKITPRDMVSIFENPYNMFKSKEMIEQQTLEIFVGNGQPGFPSSVGVSDYIKVDAGDPVDVNTCPRG